MPELPEVETMRRGLLPVLGRRVVDAEKLACPRKPIRILPRIDRLRARMVGETVTELGRVGKRVVVVLSSGDRLVIEPRMTGLVLLADSPDPLYLRLRVQMAGRGPEAFYYWDRRGLGGVRLFSEAEFAEEYSAAKIGPDALVMTADLYRTRLCASKRAIKVALLDQKIVAGIGNLYAAEMLWLAGIHPEKRCDRVTRKEWQRLADAGIEVLEEAVRHEGSTLGDGTYRNALNQDGGYQNLHRVYGRAGEACPRCGEGILRIVQAQRSTFYCRGCQRKSS
ncbi:bifunctional DNA-formamidopyrimidine glycosylase/DNA-(apurinic or apyrimidinic site) lyase [Aeoliella sp. SH292]|uniref:bifunctional DNA-formamidopyrimidine glycosylase/DNA-(apurinic or apyrimidinic site) lyase n=1 Tax=Aeoliella sp. SH292 TaxID=3454464 RepID=UPI003F982A5F